MFVQNRLIPYTNVPVQFSRVLKGTDANDIGR